MHACTGLGRIWMVFWIILSGAGCGDPGGESLADEADTGSSRASSGFGNGFGTFSSGGGIPQAGGTEATTASFEEDAVLGEFVAPDASTGTGTDEHAGFDEEGAGDETDTDESSNFGPLAYECNLGDEEECITECGSIGIRQCSKIWGPCIPPEEECNQLDDNCDGQIDEGLINACGECAFLPVEVCNGIDDDCDGETDEGVLNQCGQCGPVGAEICNGIDDNCNGEIDEGVQNACGSCGPIPPEVCNGLDDDCDGQVDEGALNACGTCGPTNATEYCNGLDDDCDGQVDENCYCEVNVNLSGDCLSVFCPAECPYPVGCDIDMAGGDPRGCVASSPDNSKVYFQEGNNCGAGKVTGTLLCASVPGAGLNQGNCAINKPQKFFPSNKSGCPDTD